MLKKCRVRGKVEVCGKTWCLIGKWDGGRRSEAREESDMCGEVEDRESERVGVEG